MNDHFDRFLEAQERVHSLILLTTESLIQAAHIEGKHDVVTAARLYKEKISDAYLGIIKLAVADAHHLMQLKTPKVEQTAEQAFDQINSRIQGVSF